MRKKDIPEKWRELLWQEAKKKSASGYKLSRLCRNKFCDNRGHCAIFENGYAQWHFDLNKP